MIVIIWLFDFFCAVLAAWELGHVNHKLHKIMIFIKT